MTRYRIFCWHDSAPSHNCEYAIIRSRPGEDDELVCMHNTLKQAELWIKIRTTLDGDQ